MFLIYFKTVNVYNYYIIIKKFRKLTEKIVNFSNLEKFIILKKSYYVN